MSCQRQLLWFIVVRNDYSPESFKFVQKNLASKIKMGFKVGTCRRYGYRKTLHTRRNAKTFQNEQKCKLTKL